MKTLVITSKEFATISKSAKYELKGIVKSIFVAENILNKVAKGNADFISSTITKDNFQMVARKCKELVTLQNESNKKYFDICMLPKNSKGVTCEVRHSKKCPKYGYELVNVSENGWDYLVPVRLDAESLFNAFINACKVNIKNTEKAQKEEERAQKAIAKERAKFEKAKNVVSSLFGDIANLMTDNEILEKYEIIRSANKRTK